MKNYLLLLLLLPAFAAAQKFALIDRGFRYPMSFTDTVTLHTMLGKRFTVYSSDIDSLIRVSEQFARHINTGKVHASGTFDVYAGHTHFIALTKTNGNVNTYYVVVSTITNNIGTSLVLVSYEGKRRTMQKLNIFLDHLRNNRWLAAEYQQAYSAQE